MKQLIQKINSKRVFVALLIGGSVLFNSCKKAFLQPEPLSLFEPGRTFNTEAGLVSAMALCDRTLKLYYATDHAEMLTLGTEYIFSDMMVAAATDKRSMLCDVANMLTPVSDQSTLDNLDRTNSLWRFWEETYRGIMYSNTIIKYIDNVQGLSENVKNAYKGRAYFHRAFRYMALVNQYGDVPLLTTIIEKPKLNYRTTKRDAILQFITKDMESAIQWVPEQSAMTMIGMVNKGACRMLLTKCYLAVGEYQKAKEQTDILINSSGYSLMQNNFGTFNPGGEAQTWPITRNVIWDLHRAENKLIGANREVILGMVNRGSDAESFTQMLTMRVLYPFIFDTRIQTRDGKQAMLNIRRNATADYNPLYDYMRAFGRGIATFRPTYFSTHTLWKVNNVMDAGDLRHSSTSGNWIRMQDYKVNNKASTEFGKPLELRNPVNNALLCSDTIRRWFDVPHYKFFLNDPVNEANIPGSDGLRGATNGGNADWYLYRLAEAYLLRAEAKFYLNPGDATIKDDLNAIRSRAKCTQLYTGTVTIGDIMNERARELYWEEWRNVELKRVSLCLARSGRPDEFGNIYSLETYDKQSGMGSGGGSYWYQRVNRYSLYNKGPITINATGNSNPNYTMDKKNMFWPIPQRAINTNTDGRLAQNFGYDGYDPSVPKWDKWEDAVADENKIN